MMQYRYKRMRGLAALVWLKLLFLFSPAVPGVSAQQNTAFREVPEAEMPASMVRRHRINVERGCQTSCNEATDYTTWWYGDINGDGRRDYVVQFTVEAEGGGNWYGFSLGSYVSCNTDDNACFHFVADVNIGGKFYIEIDGKPTARNPVGPPIDATPGEFFFQVEYGYPHFTPEPQCLRIALRGRRLEILEEMPRSCAGL